MIYECDSDRLKNRMKAALAAKAAGASECSIKYPNPAVKQGYTIAHLNFVKELERAEAALAFREAWRRFHDAFDLDGVSVGHYRDIIELSYNGLLNHLLPENE